MEKRITQAIEAYRQKVESASKELTKKELFKDLLNRLYSGNPETEEIIDAISLGAERTVLRIPRRGKEHYGSADTLYNRVIIEFENDLKKTGAHAREQLAGYMLGQLRSGEGYDFTLIASDFITWKKYAPDIDQLDKLEKLQEHEVKLNEVASGSFVLSDKNSEDFYYWLDQNLFRETKQKATLERIEEMFGYNGTVFDDSFRRLKRHFGEVREIPEVKVAYDQWFRSLSIAYGSYEGTDDKFVIQAYLSIFAKMLAYCVLTDDDFIEDDEIRAIIDGSIFANHQISNFVEHDFFYWVVSDHSLGPLRSVFRRIAQELSAFDFSDTDEDILKGIYQELIDLDTRHALGEYYTPDWLCDRIVNEFEFTKTDRILDPACGSGSFLRAAIRRIRELNSDVTVEELNRAVHGIDVHPLSVQIAKTTVLLALGKSVRQLRRPMHLNIALANTLFAPQEIETMFHRQFRMPIDNEPYELVMDIFEDERLFNDAVTICDDLAQSTLGKSLADKETLRNNLIVQTKKEAISELVLDSFYEMYRGLKKVKDSGRDSIWRFIVQNNYKPYFFKGSFDYVIGNPPWFTYSGIRNEDYQDSLNLLADIYNIRPTKKANFPHLEIAAIFLAFCSDHFLKATGNLAFVVPRSFFSADQHDHIRDGSAKGFRLVAIWDLFEVKPLFRIPCGVLFATKAKNGEGVGEWPGKVFAGEIKAVNSPLKDVESKLIETDKRWFFTRMGTSSAFSSSQNTVRKDASAYKELFDQGATIVPRAFYFVDLNQDLPEDFRDRTLQIRTALEILPDAKKPWDDIVLRGSIESRFLFRTALAKSILPFSMYQPNLVALPATVEESGRGGLILRLHSADELLDLGYRNAAKWFAGAERYWEERKTAKSAKMSNLKRLNFQRGLTGQNLNLPYLVLYSASSKDANATTVRREDIDLPFIAESKGYIFSTRHLDEAYYVTAILNSDGISSQLRDFQTRGLFGFRDIHKKILDVHFPRFDAEDERHRMISGLSRTAHEKTALFLKTNPPEHDLTPRHLGALRRAIKEHLSDELAVIDEIVLDIIT